jgi:hypothetical protein
MYEFKIGFWHVNIMLKLLISIRHLLEKHCIWFLYKCQERIFKKCNNF